MNRLWFLCAIEAFYLLVCQRHPNYPDTPTRRLAFIELNFLDTYEGWK